MGRIAIMTDEPGWHGKQLRFAFANRGFSSDYVSLTECQISINNESPVLIIPGFETNLPDAVFVRGVPGGSLEEVVFYLDILHALQAVGVPVYNNATSIEKSVDKGMTSFLMAHENIRTPATWVLRERSKALLIAEQEIKKGFQLISKPIFGSQGEGVRRLDKMTDLFWLTNSNGVYYLQRFIHSKGQGYSDIRVFVINGKAVAAMRRRGRSWLNNVARGARCERIEITDELAAQAVKAVNVLQMYYAGVDVIEQDNGEFSIIEVNSIPAWKGLESVCEINVAKLLVDDLITRFINKNQNINRVAS